MNHPDNQFKISCQNNQAKMNYLAAGAGAGAGAAAGADHLFILSS